MAAMLNIITSVALVVMVTYSGIHAADVTDGLVLKADPQLVVDNVTLEVTIDCRASETSDTVGLMMDMFKMDASGSNTFVARQRAKTMLTDDDRMSGQGHMKHNEDKNESYLTVKVKSPSFTEEGLYTCRYVYMDSEYSVHHASQTVNVTVELPPPEDVIMPEVVVVEPEVVTGACPCGDVWDEIKSLKATLYQENKQLKEEIQKYNDSCRVSFSATHSGLNTPIRSEGKVPFDDVISNQGGAFDAKAYSFITPCAGQYFFSLTLRSQQKRDSGYVDGLIMVDGVEMARTSVFLDEPITNYQSATNGAVLTLNQGQEVNVKVKTTSFGTLRGNTYSVFSGFYLFP